MHTDSTDTSSRPRPKVAATMLDDPSVGVHVDHRGISHVDAVLTFYGVWRGRPLEVEVVCDRYRRIGVERLTDWRYYVGRAREPRGPEGYRGALVELSAPMRRAFNEATSGPAGDFLRDSMEAPIARAVAFACRGHFNSSGRVKSTQELRAIVSACWGEMILGDRDTFDSALEHRARMEQALESLGRP